MAVRPVRAQVIGPHDSGSVIGDLQTQYAAQPLLQGAAIVTAVPKR